MPAKRKRLPGVSASELRAARAAAGLTQQEAAGVCDVGLRTYERWEAGDVQRIRPAYLDRLVARRQPK